MLRTSHDGRRGDRVKRRGLLEGLASPGVPAALFAAALFGAGTPFAKELLTAIDPWLLAGLLYAGSGLALSLLRLLRPTARVRLARGEFGYLLGAVLAGGVLAPVLLMSGLSSMPAAGASLLLNAEGVFTALLAWFVFRENVDRRIAFGMLAIAAGAVVLSWNRQSGGVGLAPALLVLAACFCWAIDNNLTRKVALLDATWLASVKGLSAGSANLLLALASGASWPALPQIGAALGIGALAYGVSLVLFVIALRHLGSARTTAYFSMAPFVGALVSLVWLREPLTLQLCLATALMAIGVWLHLTERHEHLHHHEPVEHEHEHVHDEHHRHSHESEVSPGVRHTHRHRHDPLTHSHHHFPDAHHQHDHPKP
jgi:drug/metabolite transporter (DMT)-like permease